MSKLPNFDHSKTWKVRGDRPPRRKVDYGPRRLKHQLSRQNSQQQENKKKKTDEMETETSSDSSDASDDDRPSGRKNSNDRSNN